MKTNSGIRATGIRAALAIVTAMSAAGASQAGPCSKTSQLAFQACRSEIQDDFLIAQGRCENITNQALAQACKSAAKAEKLEGAEDCSDALDGRNNICDLMGEAAYEPTIDPANFYDKPGIVAHPNPYFPLIPGTVFLYSSPSEDVTVTVTDETRVILGIECIVVRDTVMQGGQVVEDTDDYFAMDTNGNVWYFGEISKEFEGGFLVELEGSWIAGEDGAKPGINAFANPAVDVTYRQEWALGDAEDVATIVSVTASESAQGASCNGTCLLTSDFNPFDPEAVESKYYAPGVGFILEIGPDGERLELIQVIQPVN